MVIGFDGSRSFVQHRTGTENYAYQLLKHLAEIDTENQYVVYLRPGNVVEESRSELASQRIGELGAHDISKSSKSSKEIKNNPADVSTQEEVNSPIRQSTNSLDNYGWPENFQFKMLEYQRLWTQFGLAKQTFVDQLDLLFVPSHTLPLIRKPGLKTVMTVHDLGAEYLPGMHQWKQRLYLGLMTKIQLKTATKLLAVSEATKKDLVEKIGVESGKVEVVYEGLNGLEGLENDSKIYSEIDKKNKDIERLNQIIINGKEIEKSRYFLFVGTIQPRKNLERLIRAYAGFLEVKRLANWRIGELANWSDKYVRQSSSLGNLKSKRNGKYIQTHEMPNSLIRQFANSLPKLVLAGGKGWLSEGIYELPKKLGIEEQVIFTGRVSDEDLTLLYKHALVFTFPSLFEGFGLPVLEAFSEKVPVITSNNSSLPEVAGDAALLVDPYKVEDILEALLTLYDDKDLQKKLVKKGSEQVKKFSWEKCAKETLSVLTNKAN